MTRGLQRWLQRVATGSTRRGVAALQHPSKRSVARRVTPSWQDYGFRPACQGARECDEFWKSTNLATLPSDTGIK